MKASNVVAGIALVLGLFVSNLSEAQRVVVRVAPRPRPVVVVPARPVYVAPRRVVVAPRPVYVAPRRVVVAPRPVVIVPRGAVVVRRPARFRRY